MKSVNLKLIMFLATSLLLTSEPRAAVTFTITPAAISNTYAGTITLTVNGLHTGETVLIQGFIDGNTNGVIDNADWLAQQFQLTDGQASVVGGVTNFNVPGDTDSTAGTITARLNAQGRGIEERFVGSYAFKLSSPTGLFPPITNLFKITNSAYAQSLSGSIKCNGTNVPNATVLLFPGQLANSSPQMGALANNSGSYLLTAPAGTYGLLALKPNFVTDLTTAPTVTLNAGSPVSTNLTLLPSTCTISGRFMDAANTNLGLGGFLVVCQSANNLMAFGFTDTNGSFTVPVTASQWKISLDSDQLPATGYLNAQNSPRVDTSTGSVAGVTVAFPKGTALIWGSLKDDQNRPLPGVQMWADDDTGQCEGIGGTDANGNYSVAVTAGTWHISPDNSSPALANCIVTEGQTVTNSNGQAVQQNFRAILATNHLSGYVKDNLNNPVSNVGVYGYVTINTTTYNQYRQTDSSGYYNFNAANGNWNIGINCGGGDDSLNAHGYQCAPEQQATVAGNNPVINFTVQPCGPPEVTTGSSLPSGQTGTFYSFQLQATGCHQPFNWALAPSSVALPQGLNLSSDGTVSGVPTASGTCNFSVRVTDSNNNWIDAGLSITVNSPWPPLQITSTVLPNGMQNSFYSQNLSASGGLSPYTWWLPGGTITLPAGLALSPGGNLAGTPPASGNYNFWVGIYDSATPQNMVTQMVSLTISAPLQVTTASLPNGSNGLFYSQWLSSSGGSPPYSWSLMPGSAPLPPGLLLNASGQISGTPTNGGTYFFYARVTDGTSATADQLLSIYISNPPLQITNISLPNATVGGPYTAQMAASGGQPPYSWSLALGSANPPPGLMLNPNGLISGTPTANGLFNFIVKVTDANFGSVTRLMGITVNPKPTLGAASRPSPTQFQFQVNGAAGQNYTVQSSTDLLTWTWVAVTNAPSDTFNILLNRATNNRSYYRILVGQ